MQEKKEDNRGKKAAVAFVTLSIASLAAMRAGNYHIALQMYRGTGGGGLNLLMRREDGTSKRIFAIDYHPFFNPKSNQREWHLHYHCGKTKKEMQQHRSFTGGKW